MRRGYSKLPSIQVLLVEENAPYRQTTPNTWYSIHHTHSQQMATYNTQLPDTTNLHDKATLFHKTHTHTHNTRACTHAHMSYLYDKQHMIYTTVDLFNTLLKEINTDNRQQQDAHENE